VNHVAYLKNAQNECSALFYGNNISPSNHIEWVIRYIGLEKPKSLAIPIFLNQGNRDSNGAALFFMNACKTTKSI
jgi:hypothetical protein